MSRCCVFVPSRCLSLLCLLALSCTLTSSWKSYRPVVLIHGLFGGGTEDFTMPDLKKLIEKAHPGTNVTIPALFDDGDSLTPIFQQIPAFRKVVEAVMSSAKDGINVICYSQGGIICRALIANMSNHNIHTFVALSSPLMGQYGDTSYIPFFPQMKEDVYKACYTKDWQELFSVCNYWNDPHHRPEYLKGNIFLPKLNNETFCNYSQIWKQNTLKLQKMVLIGGPDDGVITPWQSSHYGFYNDKEEVVEMKDQEVFVKDSFGLQTLYKRGAIETHSIGGVEHLKWPQNQTVFDCCIEPYLT